MEETFIVICLVLLGLVLGSFAGATVWRLRAWQLVSDKRWLKDLQSKKTGNLSASEKTMLGEADSTLRQVNQELKLLEPLTKRKLRHDHSQCLNCQHRLAWYDLIPLGSWLSTGGRCRYCRKPIGYFEPMTEIGTAIALVALYVFWPYPLDSWLAIAEIAVWMASVVVLAILFAYDLKWFLLLDWPVVTLAVFGGIVATLRVIQSADIVTAIWSVGGSLLILSGLYLVLYWVSLKKNGEDKTWIGFGDVKLGVGLGLLLADWKLAFVALFLANFIGCLIMLPLMASGKVERSSRIPFGPLLIVGTFLSLLCGQLISNWYLGLL